jgi:hypothetical protein
MARTATRAKAAAKRATGRTATTKNAAAKKSAAVTKGVGRGVTTKAARPKVAARRNAKVPAKAKAVSGGRSTASVKAARSAEAAAPAKRTTTPRAAVPRPAAKPVTARHRFVVSHLHEADFKTDGLRPYAKYRDLGMAEATDGLCQAHVIRLVPPCSDEVRKRHTHTVDLQMVYVLKGWVKNEFEGNGEQMMSVGSCWLQPSGIEHTVLDFSPDCELLEIIVPADFKTTELV